MSKTKLISPITNFEKAYLAEMAKEKDLMAIAAEQFYKAEEKYSQALWIFLQKNLALSKEEFMEKYDEARTYELDYIYDEPAYFLHKKDILETMVNLHIHEIQDGENEDLETC